MRNTNCYHGEMDEALAAGTRALAIAERLGDSKLRISGRDLPRSRCIATEVNTSGSSNWPPPISQQCPPVQVSSFCHGPGSVSIGSMLTWSGVSPSSVDSLRPPGMRTRCFGLPSRRSGRTPLVWLTTPWAGRSSPRATGREARLFVERAIGGVSAKGTSCSCFPMSLPLARILAQLGEAAEALTRLQEGEELSSARQRGGAIDQVHGYH